MAASTVIVAINARLLTLSRGSNSPAVQKAGEKSGDSQQLIAERAYELYEQHGHQNGHAKQDWTQATREVQKK